MQKVSLRSFSVPVSPTYPSLLAKLKKSKFDNKHDLAAFAESFDIAGGLKTIFSDNSRPQFVKFGSKRDNDARCNVKDGKLELPGWVICFHALGV